MTKSNVRAPCFLLNFPPNRSIYWSRACLGKYCRCSSPRTPAAAAKKGMFLLSSPSRSQKKCLFEPFFYQKRSHAPAGSSAPRLDRAEYGSCLWSQPTPRWGSSSARSGRRPNAKTNAPILLSSQLFPVLVPSLSWQTICFRVLKHGARNRMSRFRTENDETSSSGSSFVPTKMYPGRTATVPAVPAGMVLSRFGYGLEMKKTPLFSQLSLCLSRACLCNTIILSIKWRGNGVFLP